MNQYLTQRYYLPLENLEREPDLEGLELRLRQIPSIKFLRLEPSFNRLSMEVAHSNAIPILIDELRKEAYNVPTEVSKYPLLHMSCAACAVSAESALKQLPGVLSAAVNFSNASVRIEYLPSMVAPSLLKKHLDTYGYELVIGEMEENQWTMEHWAQQKLLRLKRKLMWALFWSIPVVCLGMFYMDARWSHWAMMWMTIPVIMWSGRDFFRNAWRQAKHRNVTMDTLVAMSTGITFLFSVVNTLFPNTFWDAQRFEVHVYYEAVCVILSFILLGRYLEERAKKASNSAITDLLKLQPNKVLRMDQNMQSHWTDLASINFGDQILVRPGDRIAVDGVVLEGPSYVNESAVNGEPLPSLKQKGDILLAGTVNVDGRLLMRAEKIGQQTLLANIVRMVLDAQGSKANVQKIVDRIAAVFVPFVLLVAGLSFFVWYWMDKSHGIEFGLMAFVTVMIIACPCALGLATPTAITVGLGKAAKQGILIKDADSLEQLSQVNVILLDKTGTITKGEPQMTGQLEEDVTAHERDILFSMAHQTVHPLAKAIAGTQNRSSMTPIENLEHLPGRGSKSYHNGKAYYLGSLALLTDHGVNISENLRNKANECSHEAKSVVWFANQEKALMVMAFEDSLKPNSTKGIHKLMSLGVELHLVTGDHEHAARRVARETGIQNIHWSMKPDDKAALVITLQKQQKKVAMIGDGINDSAAFAQADVSVAMGNGSDMALDVARITLLSSDLSKIVQAIQISKQTVTTIRQNLFWAFIYNVLSIPIAAGALYPYYGFILNPMIAGAAMAMSSVSVVTNSLVLRFRKIYD